MSAVGVSEDCLAFGDFTIDRTDERLLGPQGPVRLGNKAYRVLLLLAEQEGKLLTKDALFSSVWDGTVVSESALTSVIKELRRGLNDESRSPRYIESVYGRGYRLLAEVRHGPAAVVRSEPEAAKPTPAPRGAGLGRRELGAEPQAPPLIPGSSEPARAAHPTNLPARRGELVGREAAMVELAALSMSHRLLTLCGAGGLGKTRLAMELGRDLLPRFPDGVWFAALDRVTDPGLLPEALLTMFGIRNTGDRPPAEEWARRIQRKTMLLILDNAEHLLGAVADLAAALLDDAPALTILVTSREPLGIADEQVWRVPALALPEMDDIEALQAAPAAQLLIERIAATMGNWTMPEADAATIAAICRRMDGIPLAIELVAPRFAHMTPQEVLAGIEDRFRLLGRGSRTAPQRQQTLHATFDWSYDLLAEPERILLRRLSVFSGRWSLDATENIAAGGDLAKADVLDALAALVDKSLVVAETRPGGSRYRLLDTTSAYAAEKLGEAGEEDEYAERHARYYCEIAGRAHDSFETTPGNSWRATFVPELKNFRAAMRWAFGPKGDAEIGIALAAHTGHLLVGQGLLREARQWVDLAAERLSEATPPGIAAFIHMGRAFTFAVGAAGHAKSAEAGVALARKAGEPLLLARTLNILGVSLFYSAPDQAETALSEAVSLASPSGRSKTLANSLMLRALLTQLRGDHDAAERDRSQSIEMMTALEDLISLPLVLGHQVEARIEAGDLAGAIAAARRAVEARQSLHAHVRSAHAPNHLAACLLSAGETLEGRRWAEQALAAAVDAGQERSRMLAIQSLALAACRDNAPELAARLLGFVDAASVRLPLRLPSELAVHGLLRAEVDAALAAKPRRALEAEGAQLGMEAAATLAGEAASGGRSERVYGRDYRLTPPVRAGAAGARPAPPAAAAPAPAAGMPARTGRPPLVLVSGFSDDAVRARYPYCAAELREEILSALARFREIQLIADDRPEREAAAAHGAPAERDYQLTATLMPDGDGVKVIARARRLADGRVVWAETMALADIGTAGGVERIVRRIIGAALPAVDEDVSLGLPGESGDFYDRYLIAKRLSLTARGFDEAKAVAAALEDLVAERPDFGLAYPPLVRLYNTDFGYTGLGSTGPAERARALEMAKAGLAADPGNVHAYTVLGFCHLWHEEREPARDCFDRALALNPHNAVRLNEVASGMLYLGELEATRSLLDLSLLLQPFPDDSYYTDRCLLCLLEGEAAEAASMVRKVGGQKLWARLYAALCAGAQDPAGSSAAFRSWVSSIEPCWVGGQELSADELQRWIAFHHPLSGRSKDHFMDLVQRELGAMA